MLTESQKRVLYAKGQYRFKAPPVCTAYWTDADWIEYISACNGWITSA